MANLIYKYEFLKNNPGGTYVTGDVLEVYFTEASIVNNNNPLYIETSGLTTFLNGVEIFSGGLIFTTPDVVSVEISNPKYCKGTQLIKFFGYAVWPYAFYTTIPDSQECAVNPVSCDLILVGTPETVDPSTESATDGEITINATSSYSIQYKLNQDFYYGQGQTSNSFTGLGVGNYRIFIRDEKNCAANVFVELKYISDYGEKFRLTYYDLAGFQTKIDICEREYSGAVSEYCGGGVPLTVDLRGEGETDKFTALLPVNLNLTLVSETNEQYIDLYTNDPDKYRVKYYKDFGSGWELQVTGKLLPFVYQEDYAAAPYEISVSATDGLGDLKSIDFVQDDGLRIYGVVKLIKLVASCLRYTRLGLNIRVAVNMYADGMTTTASDDPFDQAYIDTEAFYLASSDTKIDFVLKSILEPFGARIVQYDGVWNIVRLEEMGAAYDYREFDSNGDYISNSSYNPVLDIDFPNGVGDVLFNNTPNMELQAGYGKITVKYRLGLKPNFLYNGDFRLVSRYSTEFNKYEPAINIDGWVLNTPDYGIEQRYELIDEKNVALVISGAPASYTNLGTTNLKTQAFDLKMGSGNTVLIKIRYKIALAPADILPYTKVRLKVQYGSLYLMGDGTWSSTSNILTFFANKGGEYIENEIIAQQPTSGTPTTGMDFFVTVYHAHPHYADYTTNAALKAINTASLPIGYKTEVRKNNSIPRLTMYYYELTETTEAESGDDILEPVDYNAVTNPVQWILKQTGYINQTHDYTFAIDYVKASFLTNGEESIDAIYRSTIAEKRNKLQFEKELIIGSSGNTITTEAGLYFDYNKLLWPTGAIAWNVITTNVLSDNLIYTGYLRDASGVAYDIWTRDGVSEEDKIHGIWLRMYAAQYNRTWRMLRGSIVSQNTHIGLLNSFREVNDDNRIYIPISLSLNDRMNIASGEFLEVITLGGGSDGSGAAPFTSAFTTGFGSDFN